MSLAQEGRKSASGDTIVALATVTHALLAQPIRATNNGKDITSNGNLFMAAGWRMQLPDEGEESDDEWQVAIDNVSTDIVTSIKASNVPPVITLQIVMASAPNAVEVLVENYALQDVDGDGAEIRGRMTLPMLREFDCPSKGFIPSLFPGLV